MIEPAFQTHMLSHHIFYILVKHSNNLVAKLSQHENKELDIWSHVFKTAFNSIHGKFSRHQNLLKISIEQFQGAEYTST